MYNQHLLLITHIYIIIKTVRIRSKKKKKNFTNNICFNPFFFCIVSFHKICMVKKKEKRKFFFFGYINIFYVLRPTFLQEDDFSLKKKLFLWFYILIPTEKSVGGRIQYSRPVYLQSTRKLYLVFVFCSLSTATAEKCKIIKIERKY